MYPWQQVCTPAPQYGPYADAVFPCYLAHQTILVIAAFLLKPAGLPAFVEAGLLVTATLGGSVLVYELARRSGPLRPLWGLKRHAAPRAVAAGSQNSRPTEVA